MSDNSNPRARTICGVMLAAATGLLWAMPAPGAESTPATSSSSGVAASAQTAPKKFPDWDTLIKEAEKSEGLFPLYFNKKEQKLWMEISQSQYEKELICPIAIARGAGLMYLGGETLNFGDQWLLSFRRVGDRILVVRRNVRFRAKSGSPQADAVRLSYNDSVIAAVPVRSERGGGQQVLIDLADLFMTDLAGIGVTPDRSRSTWAEVKAFPDNVEVEVSAVFPLGASGLFSLLSDDSVPDPRGAQIVVHYGLSMLSSSSYEPRAADDRVGHFLSVLQDFSSDIAETPSKRYVTRWRLEKDDPSAEASPPKEPIIFWIEKTVPREYRGYVREGILEWNKAFESIGFIDAIQCRDQQATDDFDAEDIRFNTFRWIATSAGFAMGPSRTNPKTGEILDADIVFDEGMIRYWRQEYLQRVGLPQGLELLARGHRQAFFKLYATALPAFAQASPAAAGLVGQRRESAGKDPHASWAPPHLPAWIQPNIGGHCCMMGPGMQRQLGLAASVLAAKGAIAPGDKVPDELIGQAVKHIVMHEVGHTLGLRHNFKASAMLSLKEIHTPEVTRKKGLVGSVMDYSPVNFAPPGEKQGEYFSTILGPYDYWAIEYAYKPISGSEEEELAKIASRVAEPELAYGTDDDLFYNPDPRINTFDLGDPLEYAKQQVELTKQSLKDLADRVVAKGEGWQRTRTAFSLLLSEVSQATYLAAQYVGSEYTYRDHRDDPQGRTPFEPTPIAKQRDAIAFLAKQILSADAFEFPPDLAKRLAPDYWGDSWMYTYSSGYHYPIYEEVLSIQRIVLSQFLDAEVLARLQEIELHAAPGEEVLKMPEVFESLTDAVWAELPPADPKAKGRKIEISTIRRNLQREHVRRLAEMVLGSRGGISSLQYLVFYGSSTSAPADARSLARSHLRRIDAQLLTTLGGRQFQLDAYSKAHLEQLHDQIKNVLEASLDMNEP